MFLLNLELTFAIVIDEAEQQGLLYPNTGSVIFEGTVGSTGISIATVARSRCDTDAYIRTLPCD